MSNIITFEQVFTSRLFRIPDYQRGYSWQTEQLEQLWADLENIYAHLDSYHFTGTLTLNNFEKNDLSKLEKEDSGYNIQDGMVRINNFDFQPVHLIDGQQRLSTLLILLSVLIDRLRINHKKNDEAEALLRRYFRIPENKVHKYIFGYEVDVPSHQFLIGKIFNDKQMVISEPETIYTNNLLRAREYFEHKVEKYDIDQTNNLITKITKRLLFSILNLAEGERKLDISMVFETLNFRGLGLSSLELFKNRLLYLISKQHVTPTVIRQSRLKINKTWLVIYEWLGKNKDSELDDNAFLKAFWMLYFSNNSMVAADFKAYQRSLFYDIFSLQNPNNEYLQQDNLIEWLVVMRKSVKLWFFINNPYYFDENPAEFNYLFSPKIQKYLEKINKFPKGYGKYMQHLILAILIRNLPSADDDSKSEEEKEESLELVEKILSAIERHNVMCYLLYGNKTNFNQEKVFRDVNYYFEKGRGNGHSDILRSLVGERVEHFDWKVVAKNIHRDNRFFSWDGIHYILRDWESDLLGYQMVSSGTLNTVYPSADSADIRKTYHSLNTVLLHNRDKYTYSLGNLYLSRTSRAPVPFSNLHDRIQNALEKNEIIFENEKELLNYKYWSADDLKERGNKILDFIIKNWNLPKFPNQGVQDALLLDM